jgi:hypothetical protein
MLTLSIDGDVFELNQQVCKDWLKHFRTTEKGIWVISLDTPRRHGGRRAFGPPGIRFILQGKPHSVRTEDIPAFKAALERGARERMLTSGSVGG